MTPVEYVFILLGIALCFKLGYQTHAHKTVDYKKRWQEAMSLVKQLQDQVPNELNAADYGKQIFEVKPQAIIDPRGNRKKAYPAPTATFKGMSTYSREQIELKRLKKGFGPSDPLNGMSSYSKEQIMEARIEAGWDWDHSAQCWYKR